MNAHKNIINGKQSAARKGDTFEERNPARLSEVTGTFQASTAEDVDEAVTAAQAAFPAWRDMPPSDRASILTRAMTLLAERREELAGILTDENGKTLAESRIEIDKSLEEMEYQIHQGMRALGEVVPSRLRGVLAYSTRRPLGVCAVISPWNFPVSVPCRKCTPALMAGNTCVLKPASLTAHTGLFFTQTLLDAGLPPGVLNCITGGGREAGTPLITDPRVHAISFTGSTDVGIQIQGAVAQRLVRTQLELGGKNPAVVLADADLDQAAAGVVAAAYACAGQWCTSTSRAVVDRAVIEDFTARVIEKASAIKVGNGRDAAATMGPVCGEGQRTTILRYIDIGNKEGARLLLGGGRVAGKAFDDGCFIEPTIFGGVTPQMTIAQEEIFGPVLSIIEVDGFEEALEVANGVEFGLSSSIFTKSLEHALKFLDGTEVGLAHVNMQSAYKEPALPFGGVKQSGFGRPEAGREGIEFFTEHRVAYIKYD